MALADLWTFYRSTIVFVCRGRGMAIEILPERNKTKTVRVVLAHCIQRYTTSPCLFQLLSSLLVKRSCTGLGTCTLFVHSNYQWKTASTVSIEIPKHPFFYKSSELTLLCDALLN
jgi:hypothetical protein